MKGDYPDDTFTENDVLGALEGANLRYKNGQRYILSQCPLHDDKHPSVQIYKDDWFVNCHAGCGRFHITKAFPDLRRNRGGRSISYPTNRKGKQVSEPKYKTFDLMEDWKKMLKIPRDHNFKNIPLEVLDELGWRWVPDYKQYFIPYFSASKESIPFAQYRNLEREPRFIMLKDAKPTCYGTWNLDNHKLFVVEGTSDAAVLDYCAVPWIALPSASSSELLKAMAGYCKENGIELVYAGDNDSAGEKLRQALDEIMPYRVKQPRQPYKDWGDMFEAEGMESVQKYCFEELFPESRASITSEVTAKVDTSPQEAEKSPEVDSADQLKNIQKIFPGAEELTIVDDEPVADPAKSKEQSARPAVLF